MGDDKESTSVGPNPLIFDDEIRAKIKQSRVLVIGAGGIGCELLKNLVLSGFEDIEIIDLDTIDVSNLNRQFLFHKQHVGMSKAQVAKESILQFNPNAKVTAHHASIVSSDYSVSYFQEFNLVLNALDNRAARNHVNRLCLAAGVPLVESGTAGYSGQVEAIVKERTACYECSAKPKERTFPGCTIRNTPSELIHCIVWAKHLFNQLFGQHDPQGEDTDVSPDPTDSEAGGGGDGTKRVETRLWVREVAYDGEKIFQKLFVDDINTLLKMKNLWEKRQAPRPLTLQQANTLDNVPTQQNNGMPKMKEERLWSISECAEVFQQSIKGLKKLLDESTHDYLEWDKDDKFAMEFVAATANIRAHIFGINQKSLFDIKSMAGNIIPAIATSNAVIAGLIVLNAVNILRGQLDQCQSVYLRREPGPRGILISRETALAPPNPDCKSCSKKPVVTIATDLSKMKIKDFDSLVLKEWLNMTEADVILVRTGNVILSSEEGEAEDLKERTLLDLGVGDGSLLEADDFLQNFKILIITKQRILERDDPPFLVLEKVGDLTPKEQSNGKQEVPGPSRQEDDDDDDDLEMILEGDAPPRKRKVDSSPTPAKRMRRAEDQNSDDLIIL